MRELRRGLSESANIDPQRLRAAVAEDLLRDKLESLADDMMVELNLRNVVFRWGDGCEGWPALAPYNGIIVTAVAPEVPQALLDQLAPGGRMVIPVGPAGETQQLMLIVREEHGFSRRVLGAVRFVPLLNGPLA